MKKIAMSMILIIAFVFTGFAQSEKAEDKGEDKAEELAAWIEAGNKDVALSDEQEAKIADVYATMRMEINQLKDEYSDKKSKEFKAARKEIYRKHNRMIHKEILTKEQRKAKRKGKELMKKDN